MALRPSDSKYIKLLKLGPFERSPRGGWRFGTRPVANSVVARLIASGHAATDDKLVWLVKAAAPEMTTNSEPHLAPIERDIMRAIISSGVAMLRDFTDAEQELIGALQAHGLIAVKPQSGVLVVTEAGRAVMAIAC